METWTRDDLTFDVTDGGPQGGEVVILLHGFPQDRTAWDRVTPRLNEAGYRTLAPDQRGYSPRATPRSRFAYTVQQLRADVLALADAAGAETFHLVGHDWGAGVAWSLAEHHRDRVRSLVILSTPHPAAMTWAVRHADQGRRSAYIAAFQVPFRPERTLQPRLERMYTRTGMDPQDAARYAARFPTPSSLTGPLGWYRSLPASALRSARRGRRPGAGHGPAVTVPTTYLWGRDDFALGRAAAERTRRHVTGDYRFVEVDGGHWLPETHPDEVAEAVLQRAAGARSEG